MQLIQRRIKQFVQNEDGIGTLEMMLILAVIVIVAVAFRKWIMKWAQSLFASSDSEITNTNIAGNSNSISPSSTP